MALIQLSDEYQGLSIARVVVILSTGAMIRGRVLGRQGRCEKKSKKSAARRSSELSLSERSTISVQSYQT